MLTGVLLVTPAGTVLAVAIGVLAVPAVAAVASASFGVDATLAQASSIPRLLLGALAVLLAAGAYPALRATRQDPVDVLDPKGS